MIEVESRLYELVNPRIVRSTGDDRDLEGCLSIPGYVAYVTRRERVWVVAQDRHGKKYKVAGSGLLGRALQHELDHLDGKLYIDYLDSMDELIAVGPAKTARTATRRPSARPRARWPDGGGRPATMTDGPIRTVFFGSGEFAVPILDALRAIPEIELVGASPRPIDRSVGGRSWRRRRWRRMPVPWVWSSSSRPGSGTLQPSPRSPRCDRPWGSWPTTDGSSRRRSSTFRRTASSMSTHRSCRAIAVPRRSQARSWPATRWPE